MRVTISGGKELRVGELGPISGASVCGDGLPGRRWYQCKYLDPEVQSCTLGAVPATSNVTYQIRLTRAWQSYVCNMAPTPEAKYTERHPVSGDLVQLSEFKQPV